jgi:hypothetical protein
MLNFRNKKPASTLEKKAERVSSFLGVIAILNASRKYNSHTIKGIAKALDERAGSPNYSKSLKAQNRAKYVIRKFTEYF